MTTPAASRTGDPLGQALREILLKRSGLPDADDRDVFLRELAEAAWGAGESIVARKLEALLAAANAVDDEED